MSFFTELIDGMQARCQAVIVAGGGPYILDTIAKLEKN